MNIEKMDGQQGSPRRSLSLIASSSPRKKQLESCSSDTSRRSTLSRSMTISERTVKRLRLSKALTLPENTPVKEVCRRMAARRVDAALLIDSNALLCGILTDKDIVTKAIARELVLEETPVSKIMTRNPIFVLSDTLAEEALQKMVLGKFRHLPVVENGEVIALLDITKCLYDAISRMERTAEKGKAIQSAIEGVEKNWGASIIGQNTFIETLRDRVFRPSLSTIIPTSPKVVIVSPNESVLTTTKKMLEVQTNSAIVTVENKTIGILTSRDILMRVVAKNLSPHATTVDKIMTLNPECGTTETSILDALQTMQSGKFLHLPILNKKDGNIVTIIDVLDITHAAVATVENSGAIGSEAAISLMQKFWDTAMAFGPLVEDDETRSEGSIKATSEVTELVVSSSPYSSSIASATFTFKVEDRMGRMHRFSCETRSLTHLITCILKRMGDEIDRNNLPQILYEDEEHDKVILASDNDLAAAVEHARLAGLKGLRLYLDYSHGRTRQRRRSERGSSTSSINFMIDHMELNGSTASYSAVAAGAALIAGISVLTYLKRYNSS